MLHTDPSANSTPRRSDDGGFDEWLEFCRSRANSASNSATRFSAILILDNAAASNCVRSAMRWSRGSVSDPTQTVVHERTAVSIPEPMNGYVLLNLLVRQKVEMTRGKARSPVIFRQSFRDPWKPASR